MNSDFLEYKGYHSKIVFDAEKFVLRGKIEGITDLVTFESKDIADLENEFHDAVDDYLEFCNEVGKNPEKEYKGTFNVRISPDLHKKLALVSFLNGDTLNSTVEKAIKEYVSDEYVSEKNLKNTVRILTDTFISESKYQYNQSEKGFGDNVIQFPNYYSVDLEWREEE